MGFRGEVAQFMRVPDSKMNISGLPAFPSRTAIYAVRHLPQVSGTLWSAFLDQVVLTHFSMGVGVQGWTCHPSLARAKGGTSWMKRQMALQNSWRQSRYARHVAGRYFTATGCLWLASS